MTRAEIDRLIILLPTILSVIDQFKFVGRLDCKIETGRIVFSGAMEFDQKINEIREEIYKLTRLLFAKKSILTFELQDEGNKFFLTIVVDFMIGETYRVVEMADEFGMDLVIDSLFDKFITEKRQIGAHNIIEISEHFSINSLWGVPTQLDKSVDLYHFNFLFRPVSLIIPRGGKFFSLKNKKDLIHTGSGYSVTGWDIKTCDCKPKYYLDLFSIFNS